MLGLEDGAAARDHAVERAFAPAKGAAGQLRPGIDHPITEAKLYAVLRGEPLIWPMGGSATAERVADDAYQSHRPMTHTI
jgi:hypothetical protein